MKLATEDDSHVRSFSPWHRLAENVRDAEDDDGADSKDNEKSLPTGVKSNCHADDDTAEHKAI
jgi:hypothetical protein